ncbi:MAG: hypothetical protein IRY99_17930 [Isosphaeraceae bacterium]|nr:hypothetical protein [Isosphaeraceae bacterium]
MATETANPADGGCLATAVRELALEAHAVLLNGDTPPGSVRRVLRRIGQLQERVHGLPSIRRWLENLRQQVEEVPGGQREWVESGSSV